MFGFLKKRKHRIDESPLFDIANLQEIGKRMRQEDSFAFVNALDRSMYDARGMMFCVCDGMGGMADGALASDTAVQCLREDFLSLDCEGNIPAQLVKSLRAASEQVVSLLGGNGGSTAVLGVIFREKLYFACVGDSYLFLLRGEQLIRLNIMHNMCHLKYLEAIRNGCLDPIPGRRHPESAALTSFIGMAGYAIVTDTAAQPIPLQRGDVILACSDGVGGVLDEKALIKALRASSAQQACDAIAKGVAEAALPYQDNYTALVVRFPSDSAGERCADTP